MNYLKLYRKQSGISQEAMCKKLGIPRTTYSNYENGLHNIPEDTASDIAKILKIRKSVLFSKQTVYIPKKIEKK